MSTLYFVVHDYSIPAQHIREYAGATKDGRDHELRLSVKRYVPKSPQQDSSTSMTILAQGGNGFCKASQRLEETVEWSNVGANGLVQELYEPLWDDFLPRVRASGQDIKAIWTVDLVNQGVSGLLNRDLLGDDPSWFDNARDLLQVVNYFREEMTRPLVGVGHSIGATALINLSVHHPRLFANLILIEPILGDCSREGVFFAYHSTGKADSWPSRAAAEATQKKSSPWNTMDTRVVQCYLEHGLKAKEGSGGAVELVNSKDQEAVTYVRPLFEVQRPVGRDGRTKTESWVPDLDEDTDNGRSFYCPAAIITMSKLSKLRPRVFYIFGAKSVMTPQQKLDQILDYTGTGLEGSGGRLRGMVGGTTIADGGHLVPLVKPTECAQAISQHLYDHPPLGEEEQGPGRSFDRGTMRLSKAWMRNAEQEIRSMMVARRNKL